MAWQPVCLAWPGRSAFVAFFLLYVQNANKPLPCWHRHAPSCTLGLAGKSLT